MKPMNELLADIVVASGGTVTSNTRNGLLDDWLEAVSNPVAALAFVSQPQAKTVDEYSLATFSCEVTGGVAPYTYQWKKNGTNVGTNSASLSFTAEAADKNASITVVVTDSVGAVITSTPAVLGVTSYVYQLDGVTQSFRTSAAMTIPDSTNFEINVKFKSNSSSAMIIATDNARPFIYVRPDGRVVFEPIDGVFVLLPTGVVAREVNINAKLIGTTLSITEVGTANTASKTVTGLTNIQFTDVGAKSNSLYLSGYAYGLSIKVAGTLLYSIPLNNKSQGANQLATVGAVNATIVNYNPAGWTAI